MNDLERARLMLAYQNLPPNIRAALKLLLKHLPDGELGDEAAEVTIRSGPDGDELQFVTRGRDLYCLEGRCACRLRASLTPAGDLFFLRTWFRNGREVAPPRAGLN